MYGRAAEIIKIYPLAPGWIRPALKAETDDAVKSYSIWGGVPRYWEAALPFDGLESAVAELVFNRNGLFHHEPHRLLKDDMRSDVQPRSLLSVIAAGAHRLSEIAGRIGKQASSLSNPLNLLINLGYVTREIPFGETTKSTKRSLYRLCDPLLLFRYHFVYPSLSLLEQDVVGPVMQDWRTGFGHHLGRIWEELARLSVPRMVHRLQHAGESVPFAAGIGGLSRSAGLRRSRLGLHVHPTRSQRKVSAVYSSQTGPPGGQARGHESTGHRRKAA